MLVEEIAGSDENPRHGFTHFDAPPELQVLVFFEFAESIFDSL